MMEGIKTVFFGMTLSLAALLLFTGAFAIMYQGTQNIDMQNLRISNVGVPTSSTDVVTKSYADNRTRPLYVGVTGTTYTGNLGGWYGANGKCNSYSSGSHMCSVEEVILSGATTLSNGWILCETMSGTYCASSTGAVDTVTSGTCSDWGSGSNSFNGAYLDSNGLPQYTACGTTLGIHCCR